MFGPGIPLGATPEVEGGGAAAHDVSEAGLLEKPIECELLAGWLGGKGVGAGDGVVELSLGVGHGGILEKREKVGR